MKNDVVELVTVISERDADGFPVEERHLFECMCEMQSVKGVEFYSAANAGMKVSLLASLNFIDYRLAIVEGVKPSIVVFDGVDYRIVRAYMKRNTDEIELTLTEVE